MALLGGTGRAGFGLALRLALAGVHVHLGSRDEHRAAEVATRVSARLEESGGRGGAVAGHTNQEAAARAPTVIITVPYQGLARLLDVTAPALADRVVVSTVVPVRRDPDLGPVGIAVREGSAAERIAARLPRARVVGAFHSLSSAILRDPRRRVDGDVVITGDDGEAKMTVAALVELLDGARAVDAGPLRYARYSEGMAILLLSVNQVYRANAGLAITGIAGSGWRE